MKSDFNTTMAKSPIKDWTYKKLIDCTSDGNLSYGIVQPGTHDEKGIPIIRVNNVNNGQLRLNDVLHVSAEIESKYKRTRLEGGEVLLTLVGSTGQSVVVPKELAGWNIARAIGVIRPKEGIGANWINICLQTREVQQFLDERANTTVQKTLNLGDVRELPIPIPPDDIKKRIENIAMSLADKMEVNGQINQTLEQIAQTIFKSWFIDFEPVKAKIEAKAAGHDPERAAMCAISGTLDQLSPEQYQQLAATAALFPDELVESELGLIPQGWSVSSVYSVSDVIYGAPFASAKFNTDGVGKPLIRIRDLRDEAPGVFTPENHPKGYMVQPGDIVVGMDGEFRAYLWGGEEALLNQRVCVFKPKVKVPSAFVRCSIMPCLSSVEASETATTVIHLGKNDIDRFRIVIPKPGIMESFGEVVDPIYAEIVSLKKSSRTLAVLRDTLLPKLLSGEIEINVANGD